MRFELTIPDPSSMRVGKEAYVTVGAGARLHRIHPEIYAPDGFNATSAGNARFSPIRDVAGSIIPTIYAAGSFECAVCEIILRCPDNDPDAPMRDPQVVQVVFPADYRRYMHSVLTTKADLKLVDLTNAGQRRIGVNLGALVAGPRSTYPGTRAWAEKIHASCPSAQGLIYTSVQLGPSQALVLFKDRCPENLFDIIASRRVENEPCHSEIRDLAAGLSIEYFDF